MVAVVGRRGASLPVGPGCAGSGRIGGVLQALGSVLSGARLAYAWPAAPLILSDGAACHLIMYHLVDGQ